MAEKRSIYQFETGTLTAQTCLLVDSVDVSATSGYTTEKTIVLDLGNFISGGINYTQYLETDAKSIFGAINELLKYCKNFAPEYNPEHDYSIGDYCIYLGTLYKCLGDTSGDWDSDKWVTTYICDELGG